MATTAEIAAAMKPWVANWNALISITDVYTKYNTPQVKLQKKGNLSYWFNTSIRPIYDQTGIAGSTINLSLITNRDLLLEQYRKLASELPGIFNSIGVFPATSQGVLSSLNRLLNEFATFNENPPQSTVTPRPIKQPAPSAFIKPTVKPLPRF